MNINEILNLEADEFSIRKILEFLQKPLPENEATLAYKKKFEIEINLGQLNNAYNSISNFLKNTKTENYKLLSDIYTLFIDVCFKLEKYQKAYEYIMIRHQTLSVLEGYKTTLDLINYKILTNEPYFEDLLNLQNDSIPLSVKKLTHELMFKYYLDEKKYEEALEKIKVLYNFDLKYKYIYDELDILIKINKFDEARIIGEKEILEKSNDLKLVYYLMQSYIHLDLFAKIETLDSKYESLFEQAPLKLQVSYYEILRDYYQNKKIKVSYDFYKKKQSKTAKLLEEELKKLDTLKREQEKELIVKLSEEVVEEEIKTPKSTLETNEALQTWLLYAYQIDLSLPLREYLRQLFIHIDGVLNLYEYIIYTDKVNPNFYMYKKERLYDKYILKPTLNNTVIEETLNTYKEQFGKSEHFKTKTNPLKLKTYEVTEEINYIFSFPIGEVGVFMVHLKEEPNDLGVLYDKLKGISQILYSRIIVEDFQIKQKREINYFNNLLKHPALYMRDLGSYDIAFNENFSDLVDINTHLPLELYIKDIEHGKVYQYERLIKKMFNRPNQNETIVYNYKDFVLEEHLYSINKGEEVRIISIFNNLTKTVYQTNKLEKMAHTDNLTRLPNEYSFAENAPKYLDSKTSFLLIEIDLSLKYIYGSNKMDQYFKEFAGWVKKFFQNGDTYRYFDNQLLVVLKGNDIRTITQNINEMQKELELYKILTIPFQPFKYNIGILRYPVVTSDKDINKIKTYLDVALSVSKNSKERNYHFFIFQDYEAEIQEQTIINYLNNAIEYKQLDLQFRQIIDLENQLLLQYESELVVPNIDVSYKYIYQLALKRNRLIDLEYEHIKEAMAFMKKLKDETDYRFKITIPISKQTFLSPGFINFFFHQVKKYNINNKFLALKIFGTFRSQSYILMIKEFTREDITVETDDLETAMMHDFSVIHVDYKKQINSWQNYLKHLSDIASKENKKLIIRNVDTREDVSNISKLGLKYFEGELYKKISKNILLNKIKERI